MPEPRELRGEIEQLMARHGVPGAAIAVSRHHRLEWAAGFGVKRAGAVDATTADTLFPCASLSKPVTALAVLALVEAKRVSLDEDVNRYLMSWRVPDTPFTHAQKVTLRRLLSHSAGFMLHGVGGYPPDGAVPSLLDLLRGTSPARNKAQQPYYTPGSGWKYSGGGYLVAQQVIEDVTGLPFAVAAKELVFDRIGMTRSTFAQPLPKSAWPDVAEGHVDGMPLPGGSLVYPGAAAAGLWSTARELAQFLLALQATVRGDRADVISPALAREMFTTQQRVQTGLGFRMPSPQQVSAQFHHSGAHPGCEAFLLGTTDSGGSVVLLANACTHMRFTRDALQRLGHAEAIDGPGELAD